MCVGSYRLVRIFQIGIIKMIKNYFYISLLASFVFIQLQAVTINGNDINTITSPGNTLMYKNVATNNIFISVKNGAIEIGSLRLNNYQGVKDFLKDLETDKDQLYQNVSKDRVTITSGAHIRLNGAYISGDNQVLLEAKSFVEITDAILKSKEIVLIGNDLNLERCFIDSDVLQIEATSPNSVFKILRFTFDKSTAIPATVQGKIDFANNETGEDFLITGANQVEIIFADHAFANKE